MNATDAVMQAIAEEGLLGDLPLAQELRLQQRITVALAPHVRPAASPTYVPPMTPDEALVVEARSWQHGRFAFAQPVAADLIGRLADCIENPPLHRRPLANPEEFPRA